MSRQCMDGREGDADVCQHMVLKPYVDTAPQNVVPLLFWIPTAVT